MDTIIYFRSIDAFQKAHGNFTAVAILSDKIAKEISKNLKTQVLPRHLDGFIADAHIYDETINDAVVMLKNARRSR